MSGSLSRDSSNDHLQVSAARRICQEARVLLTSLRGGPPAVARGDLAHDLTDLRLQMAHYINNLTHYSSNNSSANQNNNSEQSQQQPVMIKTRMMMDPSRPFLQVVTDPRAAGPHTLVALRAIYRLYDTFRFCFDVKSQHLLEGVLACKFEQTDAAQDEAVEMAIADVICLLLTKDSCQQQQQNEEDQEQREGIQNRTFMDAFNTVFVTRNTFVHSPSLCYHFEDVLTSMTLAVFSTSSSSSCSISSTHQADRRCMLFQFLVSQLLHTPLLGIGAHSGGVSEIIMVDDATRDVQVAHDATRVLCLRLVRIAISSLLGASSNDANIDLTAGLYRPILHMIQDDLCLSLVMTGQAIWAYNYSASSNIDYIGNNKNDPQQSPGGAGFVSLELLSEITTTIDFLWHHCSTIRPYLIVPFQAIWTGFFTKALVLLRKRRVAEHSRHYHSNLLFDAEVEVILESLADMLCLHNHSSSLADGGEGGTLESIFVHYDCNLHRSDVATDLFVELCRCCGGTVNEDGEVVLATLTPSSSFHELDFDTITTARNTTSSSSSKVEGRGGEADVPSLNPTKTPPNSSTTAPPSTPTTNQASSSQAMLVVEHPLVRQVPPHLKELCAQALAGGMKCLFRDDQPSEETLKMRATRKRSIMLRHLNNEGGAGRLSDPLPLEVDTSSATSTTAESGHHLRDIKSQKRLMRRAARIFNKKASKGIEFLVDSGLTTDPVTPESVAAFLRNGLVVGLDKKAVGMYLGESGKSPVAGKSPPDWERDWFHKEVLRIYCSLFRFEKQSLLDGLRMFLAAFRLPGEAQQIDRILQAFSDSCGQVCEESSSGRLKLFSEDPKRASDTAYLLSFSIIMLNTDRHNTNIREDRKMSLEDFIKNNTDYGRDITEPGKEFPREYLQSIYDSIREEEIRTEGEGADGAMTVERWKDVLRGTTVKSPENFHPTLHDAEDLTELILEHVWKPIVSAVGALWGVRVDDDGTPLSPHQSGGVHASDASGQHSGMMGVQGARLGMDLAVEMLRGVRKLGRIDIFRKIFLWVCDYTGLLGECTSDAVARTWTLTNSVEAQSAVVVALTTAVEAGEDLDEECWKRVWLIVMELRDLKVIPLHSAGTGNSILAESDPDLLGEGARREWTICLIKGDMNFDLSKKTKKSGSLFASFGRALFGGDGDEDSQSYRDSSSTGEKLKSAHGKEDLVVWDDCGPSDDEADDDLNTGVEQLGRSPEDADDTSFPLSPGAKFEGLLIKESLDLSRRMDMPVTGLERVEETRRYQQSPRARVRDRFRHSINFKALVSDSRFMDDRGVLNLLKSLVSLVTCSCGPSTGTPAGKVPRRAIDRSYSSCSTESFTDLLSMRPVISPASEALAEVLICELALKNKDRLKVLWMNALQDHYVGRLTSILMSRASPDTGSSAKIPGDPGLEKRITGLFRLSVCALKREEVANDVLACWKFVLPMNAEQHAASPLRVLDRHFGEGLWRIVSQTESLSNLNNQGWEGLVSLLTWGANRGCTVVRPARHYEIEGRTSFSEDDLALQTYRSLHLLLNAFDLVHKAPMSIVDSIRILVQVGEQRHYSQLSIASLDLLHLLLEKRLASLCDDDDARVNEFWGSWWRKIVEGISEAAELSSDTNVRQHALSVLTDLFLDKNGSSMIPCSQLSSVLSDICVPLAGRRILKLQMGEGSFNSPDELMIEFELCIGLIFKPLRHHLQNLLAAGTGDSILSIWKSVLKALEELLCQDKPESSASDDVRSHQVIPKGLEDTMYNLANEHLRNALVVLISSGVILSDDDSNITDPSSANTSPPAVDITTFTIESVSRMGISEGSLREWKQQTLTPQE